jgi:hypothetical protein
MSQKRFFPSLSEDWWSVIIAFFLILLVMVGLLGKHGLMITF